MNIAHRVFLERGGGRGGVPVLHIMHIHRSWHVFVNDWKMVEPFLGHLD